MHPGSPSCATCFLCMHLTLLRQFAAIATVYRIVYRIVYRLIVSAHSVRKIPEPCAGHFTAIILLGNGYTFFSLSNTHCDFGMHQHHRASGISEYTGRHAPMDQARHPTPAMCTHDDQSNLFFRCMAQNPFGWVAYVHQCLRMYLMRIEILLNPQQPACCMVNQLTLFL